MTENMVGLVNAITVLIPRIILIFAKDVDRAAEIILRCQLRVRVLGSDSGSAAAASPHQEEIAGIFFEEQFIFSIYSLLH